MARGKEDPVEISLRPSLAQDIFAGYTDDKPLTALMLSSLQAIEQKGLALHETACQLYDAKYSQGEAKLNKELITAEKEFSKLEAMTKEVYKPYLALERDFKELLALMPEHEALPLNIISNISPRTRHTDLGKENIGITFWLEETGQMPPWLEDKGHPLYGIWQAWEQEDRICEAHRKKESDAYEKIRQLRRAKPRYIRMAARNILREIISSSREPSFSSHRALSAVSEDSSSTRADLPNLLRRIGTVFPKDWLDKLPAPDSEKKKRQTSRAFLALHKKTTPLYVDEILFTNALDTGGLYAKLPSQPGKHGIALSALTPEVHDQILVHEMTHYIEDYYPALKGFGFAWRKWKESEHGESCKQITIAEYSWKKYEPNFATEIITTAVEHASTGKFFRPESKSRVKEQAALAYGILAHF